MTVKAPALRWRGGKWRIEKRAWGESQKETLECLWFNPAALAAKEAT